MNAFICNFQGCCLDFQNILFQNSDHWLLSFEMKLLLSQRSSKFHDFSCFINRQFMTFRRVLGKLPPTLILTLTQNQTLILTGGQFSLGSIFRTPPEELNICFLILKHLKCMQHVHFLNFDLINPTIFYKIMQNIRLCTLARSCLADLRPSIFTSNSCQIKRVTEIHISCFFMNSAYVLLKLLITENWMQSPGSFLGSFSVIIHPTCHQPIRGTFTYLRKVSLIFHLQFLSYKF